MPIVLIIMDLVYYKAHFKEPEAALAHSVEQVLAREAEFETGPGVDAKTTKSV